MTENSMAYKYDKNGYYSGVVACQIDPIASRQAGTLIFLLPASSTWSEPLPEKEGYRVKFTGQEWVYEEIEPEPTPPEPTPEELIREEVERLKAELASTDYKIIKCSEYQMNSQDLPYDVAELHTQRQAIRDRINELEN